MLPTRRELLRLAAETRFEGATLEKVVRLGDILSAVADRSQLRKALVLKGGTALNLFFGPPTRLSVDLDFNYVGQLDRDAMLAERPRIERELESLTRARGYVPQWSPDAHAGRKMYLGYRRTVDGLEDRVEMDLNFLHRVPLLAPEPREMWMPGTLQRPEFRTLSFEELAAGKVMAFLDRGIPRDAWDVAQLARISRQTWPDDRGRSIFVAMAGALPHPLHSYRNRRLQRINEAEVVRQLHPMLIASERPDAQTLRKRAWDLVESLVGLTMEEHRFVDLLQKGELRPELLFPDNPDLARRVEQSPPLRWKALNARKHHQKEG